jgi:hypothetical protein
VEASRRIGEASRLAREAPILAPIRSTRKQHPKGVKDISCARFLKKRPSGRGRLEELAKKLVIALTPFALARRIIRTKSPLGAGSQFDSLFVHPSRNLAHAVLNHAL